MGSVLSNQSLSGRTLLISPNDSSGELARELEDCGARVLTWPILDIGEPENHEALDEAIGNLFGYDWLIFQNINAVNFLLRRFQNLGHEIGELDAVRVCGLGEETVRELEESQVHVDVIPDRLSSQAIFAAIETYVGGREPLRGLNFLVPSAGAPRGYLPEALEDAGGRVDLIPAYRTCSANDPGRLNALLTGGGIDCIAFTNASEVREFAQVFDTNDLDRLLADVAVGCVDDRAAQAASLLGLTADIISQEAEAPALAQAIGFYFRPD